MADFNNPTTGNSVFAGLGQKYVKNSLVEENVLHRYASYNYVLTLSALSRNQLDNPDNIPTDAPHDIIARTGGIGDPNTTGIIDDTGTIDTAGDRTIKPTAKQVIGESQRVLNKGRDLYFNSCVIDSFPRPNEFRKLMNYTKIEMQLEEPNGITFWEKCRAAAFNNGYRNHTTAPFLITIEFKGLDSLGNMIDSPVPKRVYPVRLSKSSLQMNAGSTTYTVEAYPWTEFAMINAFLFTRSTGRILSNAGGTIQEMCTQFAKNLNKDILDNEKNAGLRETVDKYEITVDNDIGRLQTESGNQYPVTGPLGIFTVARLSPVTYRKNTSIIKTIEDLVRQFEKYNNIEKIILDQAKRFADGTKISEEEQYVDWYKIITTVKENPEFDNVLKTHSRTIRYHVKTFKIHILNFVKAGYGFSFDYDLAVRKKFNYTYTGQNLDILDLNIEYNAGYYQSILRKADPSFFNKILQQGKKVVRSLFGSGTFEADTLLPLHQYITTIDSESPTVQGQDESIGAKQALGNAQYDYLVNPKGDMVNVEMKIMGDPAFLGQDYAIPMKMGNEKVRAKIGPNLWDAQLGAFNFDNGEVVVQLNFKFPSDFDENTGLYKFNTEATPQFSGLYRVIKVESNLQNGQFTQNLTMARCNNQQKVTAATLRWSGQNSDDGSKSATGPSENFGIGDTDGA